jgi:hypothetical protein
MLSTNRNETLKVVVDSIPCPISEERWRKPNDEEDLKVYTSNLWLKRDGESRTSKKIEKYVQGGNHNMSNKLCRGSNLLREVLKLVNCLMVRHTPHQLHLLQEIQWTWPLP